ncbi:Sleepless protein [Popillia japonica]|uniref:Sleepless protein n=1 Tax=Popillia japonica TaxID=7064 RepID=A0AAW1NJQ5_POPJA
MAWSYWLPQGHCNIKCYSCSSQEDPQCRNPEGKLETRKCNEEAMMQLKSFAEKIDARYAAIFDVELRTAERLPLSCMKQVTMVRGTEHIIRGCQLNSGHPDICIVVQNESNRQNIGNVTHCSLCHSDACNSAFTIRPFETTVMLISLLAQRIMF